ncbi:hypothetical protein LINPERPRIM_LOCUS27151 [Linum perenne]
MLALVLFAHTHGEARPDALRIKGVFHPQDGEICNLDQQCAGLCFIAPCGPGSSYPCLCVNGSCTCA